MQSQNTRKQSKRDKAKKLITENALGFTDLVFNWSKSIYQDLSELKMDKVLNLFWKFYLYLTNQSSEGMFKL